jgi:hypothetical protein
VCFSCCGKIRVGDPHHFLPLRLWVKILLRLGLIVSQHLDCLLLCFMIELGMLHHVRSLSRRSCIVLQLRLQFHQNGPQHRRKKRRNWNFQYFEAEMKRKDRWGSETKRKIGPWCLSMGEPSETDLVSCFEAKKVLSETGAPYSRFQLKSRWRWLYVALIIHCVACSAAEPQKWPLLLCINYTN